MDAKTVDKLARRVQDARTPPGRRRRAARRLATTASPKAAEALAVAAVKSADATITAIMHRAAAALAGQDSIDAVCGVWRDTVDGVWRYLSDDAGLGELVRRSGWLASRPPELRVLTALHTGQPGPLVAGDAKIARALVAVADDKSSPLRERARDALAGLARQDARDAVCEQAVDGGSPAALDAAIAGSFAPADRARRAVLLFLAGEFERYAELDFDGTLLRSVHAVAHQRVRARLARHARESGRVDWVRVVTRERQPARLGELTDDEWEATLGVLTEAGRWEELWQLAVQAPPRWAAGMLRALGTSRWRPATEPDRTGYAKLITLAGACPDTVPSGTFTGPRRIDGPSYSGRTYPRFALSPDGGLMALSGFRGTAGGPGDVMVWRVRSGEQVAHLTGFGEEITALAITQDDVLVAGSAGEYGGGTLRLWRLPSGEPIITTSSSALGAGPLAVTPDGSLLAAVTRTGWGVELRRLPSCERAQTISIPPPEDPLPGHIGGLRSLVITPDGTLLAAGDDHGRVHLWRLPHGEPAGVLEGHQDGVSGLAVTPDGSLLAAATYFEGIRLWRIPSGELAGTIDTEPGTTNVTTTPDSSLLLAGKGSYNFAETRLWRLPAGTDAGTLGPRSQACGLGVTQDGLLVMANPGRITLWRSALHELVGAPAGAVTPAEIERCRQAHGDQPAVRAWLDLTSALAARRRRYDIEVADGAARVAGRADIEVDGG